jgi:hypothetical protein
MTSDLLFTLATGIAGIGWAVIILASPFWKRYDGLVIGVVVVLLAVAYTVLNFSNFHTDLFKKFSTLPGVMDLFRQEPIVTAAWCHILAFDLIGAVWMKKNSLKHNISHGLLIIPLVITFVLGPLGFLIYILIRWIKTRQYFAEN